MIVVFILVIFAAPHWIATKADKPLLRSCTVCLIWKAINFFLLDFFSSFLTLTLTWQFQSIWITAMKHHINKNDFSNLWQYWQSRCNRWNYHFSRCPIGTPLGKVIVTIPFSIEMIFPIFVKISSIWYVIAIF